MAAGESETAAVPTTDEWEVHRLDLDAYLRRIGHHGPVDPTGATLTALHRAHVASIPFENLDLVLGRGVDVDLGSVQAKLVGRRRGGYCYEHGVLFAAVLDRLGFGVDRLLARIGYDEHRPRPRSHMTLHVRADDGQWLADVGFGAGLLEPLPWDATGAPQQQGDWTYQLHPVGPGSWAVREAQAGGWTVLYSFTEEPQHAADVQVANHFTATHPSSPFVGQLVAMTKDTHVQRRLRGRLLSVVRPGGRTDERELTGPELLAELRDGLGLRLSADDQARLVDSVAHAHPS